VKELFGPDPYRAIVTQVLPGLIGSSTWIIALYDRSPGARKFLDQNTPIATGALVLAAIFWGFVCEDLGSRIEVWIERWQTRRYIRRAYVIEPPGIRYLRTLVTRMKFELNAAIALFSAAVGIKFAYVSFVNPLWLEASMTIVGIFLLLEGRESVTLLRDLRERMQEPITVIGRDGT
jgi:hypothetical protein